MVSKGARNYAVGNLRAGPSQWRRMYSTGASVAFGVNVLLAYLNVVPAILNPTTDNIALTIVVLLVELINAMLPVVAWAFDRPAKAVFTVLLYVFTGLAYWTIKYEAATSGF